MTSLFEQELIAMEQEVRDLKTLHLRGLGTTRFYSAQVEFEKATSQTFEAHIAADEPTPAIMQCLINLPTPILNPLVDYFPQPYGASFLVMTLSTASGQGKVAVISSSALSQVVKQ